MTKSKWIKAGSAVLAAAVVLTGVWTFNRESDQIVIPELVEHVDTDDGTVVILEEEVPLAVKPSVKVKTTVKKSVKQKKLKSKAKKSTVKTKKTTKKKNKTTKSSSKKVTTNTTTQTTVKTITKKNSKNQRIETTVKTTVKTTTTAIGKSSSSKKPSSTATNNTTSKNNSQNYTVSAVTIRSIAPKANPEVLTAYELLEFNTEINSGVNYSGYFSAKDRKITLRKKGDAIYHELGHFVGWLAGNADTSAEFNAIYNKEKSKLTGANSAYLTKTNSEYFAESYGDYILDPQNLRNTRPETYAYIEKCLKKITPARANAIKAAYSKTYWK